MDGHPKHAPRQFLSLSGWDVVSYNGCIGRTLRSLQRTTEALAPQQELLAEWEKSEEGQDGYVFEEMAGCLLVLGRTVESRSYFAQAYALLHQDLWLVVNEGRFYRHRDA